MSKIILFITIFIFWFVNIWFANIKFWNNSDDFKKNLVSELIESNQWYSRWKRSLVDNFCKFVTKNGMMINEWSESQNELKIYDPRQSVFLFFLCNHIWDYSSVFEINDTKIEKYMKKTNFDDLKLICQNYDGDGILQPRWCVPGCEKNNWDLNSCDFNLLTRQVMIQALNDHSNMALGLIYGNYWEKEIDELANYSFFKHSDFLLYNDTFAQYPQTHNYLKRYIKKAREISKKNYILDFETISKIWNQKKPDDCNSNSINSTNPKYDLMACNFSNNRYFADDSVSILWFVNASYNEIFWYNVFGQYYIHLLNTEQSLVDMKITDRPVSHWQKLTVEAEQFEFNLKKISDSMHQNVKFLTNLQSSFWIHIALKVYYEEVIKFRDALAKTYTPLHQLYYKLRNVQSER